MLHMVEGGYTLIQRRFAHTNGQTTHVNIANEAQALSLAAEQSARFPDLTVCGYRQTGDQALLAFIFKAGEKLPMFQVIE